MYKEIKSLEEFNYYYKRAKEQIRCPLCGRSLGFINGVYNLRCKHCKDHPVIIGDTSTKKQWYKVGEEVKEVKL